MRFLINTFLRMACYRVLGSRAWQPKHRVCRLSIRCTTVGSNRLFGHWLDVVRLKVVPTAALGTLPSISLKRQKAVGEIDFTIVLWCKRLDIGRIYDGVVAFL